MTKNTKNLFIIGIGIIIIYYLLKSEQAAGETIGVFTPLPPNLLNPSPISYQIIIDQTLDH
jgi:hypothetical protein